MGINDKTDDGFKNLTKKKIEKKLEVCHEIENWDHVQRKCKINEQFSICTALL